MKKEDEEMNEQKKRMMDKERKTMGLQMREKGEIGKQFQRRKGGKRKAKRRGH